MELTSPTTGWVHSLKAEVGDTINVGQTICEIRTEEESEEAESSAEVLREEEGPKTPAPVSEDTSVTKETDVQEADAKHTTPLPSGPSETSEPTGVDMIEATPEIPDEIESGLFADKDQAMDSAGSSQFTGEGAILPSAPPSYTPPTEAVPQRGTQPDEKKVTVKASPAVRTLAAKLAVDLSQVVGTGEGGRVTKEDLHALAPSRAQEGSSVTPVDRGKDEVTRVEFGRTRKVMWRAMGSMGDVPHFG